MAILHSRPLVSSTPAAGGMAPGSAACPSRKLRSRNSLAAGSGCSALCSVKFRRYDAKLGSRMPAHVENAALQMRIQSLSAPAACLLNERDWVLSSAAGSLVQGSAGREP